MAAAMSRGDSPHALSAPPRVDVVACKFLHYGCDRPMFAREYTRSNRKRKTKILRCFPHCCPEHASRCYCGCPIHVLVTFADAAAAARDSDIVVCARFEPSAMHEFARSDASHAHAHTHELQYHDSSYATPHATRKLARGEQVVVPRELLQPMAKESAETLWVRAYRESNIKQQGVPEHSVLYVLNSYRYPKWFYSYESGATKSQRGKKHYLRAYVLQLEQPLSRGAYHATVLARHASPSFTIISYRRASDAQRLRTGAAAPAVDDNDRDVSGDDSASSTESESETHRRRLQSQSRSHHHRRDAWPTAASSHEGEYDNAEGMLLELRYGAHSTDPFGSAATTTIGTTAPSAQWASTPSAALHVAPCDPLHRYSRSVEEQLFWRAPSHAATLERAQQLAVLHYIIAHAPADELWGALLRLESRVHQVWVDPLVAASRDARTRELLARFRLPSAAAAAGGGFALPFAPSPQLHHDEELSLFAPPRALALCAEVAVELVGSRTLQDAMLAAAAAAAATLTSSSTTVSATVSAPSGNSESTAAAGESAPASRSTSTDGVNVGAGTAASQRHAMREHFEQLVDCVHAHLSAFLAARYSSVESLVDDLVTLAHQSPRLRPLRLPVRALLAAPAPDRCAFEAFCAQAREVAINAHWRTRAATGTAFSVDTSSSSSSSNQRPGRWSRRWLFSTRSLLVRGVRLESADESPFRSGSDGSGGGGATLSSFGPLPAHHHAPTGLAVAAAPSTTTATAWELLSMLHELGAVDLQVDTSASLRVRTAWRVSSPPVGPTSPLPQCEPMHLRLDGKYRIFRTFPSGLSTLAVARHGWAYGDYFGFLESAVSIKMWLFAYRSNAVVRRADTSTGTGAPTGRAVVIGGPDAGASSGGSLARCIAVHLMLVPEGTAGNDSPSDGYDRVLVSVKVDEAPYPATTAGVASSNTRSSSSSSDVGCELSSLSSTERHALWKTLTWQPSAEFEVQYEQIVA